MADNQCINLLKDGVYSKHITTQTADQTADYKSYFSSDEFRKDLKDGKVNVGIGVEIEGVPLKLDYGSNDTQISEFQKKVRDSVDFKLTSNFYLNNAETFADKNLIDGYNECIRINQLGFKIWHEKTNGQITFNVKYSNLGGLANPILESVYFLGKNPTYRTLNDGQEVANNAENSFTYNIEADLKDGTFIIDTNLSAQSHEVNLRKKGVSSDSSPIGTIITSFLSWDKFQVATENNKESGPFWKSEFSYWAPCDGRKVPKSAFEDLTSESTVPDFRGIFLRGLNIFDAYEVHNGISIVSDIQKDPENNRTVGSWQEDQFKAHSHNYETNRSGDSNSGSGNDPSKKNFNIVQSSATGGDETRPKNKAVYYYIRIN